MSFQYTTGISGGTENSAPAWQKLFCYRYEFSLWHLVWVAEITSRLLTVQYFGDRIKHFDKLQSLHTLILQFKQFNTKKEVTHLFPLKCFENLLSCSKPIIPGFKVLLNIACLNFQFLLVFTIYISTIHKVLHILFYMLYVSLIHLYVLLGHILIVD